MKVGQKPGFSVRQSVPKPNTTHAGNRQHDREIHAGFPCAFLTVFHGLDPQHPRPIQPGEGVNAISLRISSRGSFSFSFTFTNHFLHLTHLLLYTRLEIGRPLAPAKEKDKGTNSNHHRSFDRRHDIHLSLSKAQFSGPVLTGITWTFQVLPIVPSILPITIPMNPRHGF
jgi:hypothetical protein